MTAESTFVVRPVTCSDRRLSLQTDTQAGPRNDYVLRLAPETASASTISCVWRRILNATRSTFRPFSRDYPRHLQQDV